MQPDDAYRNHTVAALPEYFLANHYFFAPYCSLRLQHNNTVVNYIILQDYLTQEADFKRYFGLFVYLLMSRVTQYVVWVSMYEIITGDELPGSQLHWVISADIPYMSSTDISYSLPPYFSHYFSPSLL